MTWGFSTAENRIGGDGQQMLINNVSETDSKLVVLGFSPMHRHSNVLYTFCLEMSLVSEKELLLIS